ncbi:YwiC-like family protein [Salisediminibacterium selenitireducens]|uniref:YwiC-like protein n=1 Tax=Bacillus selenitireducens (strain ATCC 700615 / DSM 15326 / MLS10) TaxID=439292 RepID=D6XTA7_BACIE|nr:YwiC-like family protein [Salisediminibacterium selenitireducens]ADH99043.1 conserved hypothetical protein [[Bacillus] selenitireducens MLS10]
MKWYIPREHGAWAMLIVPYWTAAAAVGVSIHHVWFFMGIFFVYLTQAPLLTWIKQPSINDGWPSFIVYLSIGLIFTIPYLAAYTEILKISLFIIPFFMMNVLFAKMKKERLLINDACAIAGLSGLGFLAWQLGGEPVTEMIVLIVLFNFVFFCGSVFHVKGLIREKRNVLFKRIGKGYHILLILFFYVFASMPLVVVGIITFIKTLTLDEQVLDRPVKIGVVEIMNSIAFFIGVVMFVWG